MAAETPVYDLMLLLDADAPSERRSEILSEVEAMIARGGTVVSRHDWGVRNLAYEIAHRKDAEYHLIQIQAPPELLDRLRGALKVTDGILRHRVVRLRPGMPPPPAVRAEPRAADAAPAAAAPAPEAPAAGAPAAGAPEAAPAPAAAPAPEAGPSPDAPAAA